MTPNDVILATLQAEGPSSTHTLIHLVAANCRSPRHGQTLDFIEASAEVVANVAALVRAGKVVGIGGGRWSLLPIVGSVGHTVVTQVGRGITSRAAQDASGVH